MTISDVPVLYPLWKYIDILVENRSFLHFTLSVFPESSGVRQFTMDGEQQYTVLTQI